MTEVIRTENDAIIEIAEEAARAQAEPAVLAPGTIYAFPTERGPEIVDLAADGYLRRLPAPARKQGLTVVEDVASFQAYYTKHGDEDSETFVNIDSRAITAVLNAHSQEGPRWGDHRLILRLRTTNAWAEWIANDRKWLSQREWAEFVEDHLADIREPAAAEMLEIASTFQAKTTVKFSSATRLSSGDANLVWEETTDAAAGAKGHLKVPTEFKIAVRCLELPVAEGEDPTFYAIAARFRFRVERGGELRVQYLLDDPDAKLRDAVLDVVQQVERGLGIEVLRGTPA
ncbi:DUF2303 family protein [Nonomuraea spiralis]|uniref:DUF2303 family protein n=1 Tax=Nonomuraea spiralis TaxID=46182 RepID=A0ABV5IYI5_9ACTN|nr:DUF2303 family protein [Nonomuraea spiralis]GGS88280.1 hypothetical protein GCM10010176_035050 [Nonomuraea spiralis]